MSEEPDAEAKARFMRSWPVKEIIGVVVGAIATAYFAHREVEQKELTKAQANWDSTIAFDIIDRLKRIEDKCGKN